MSEEPRDEGVVPFRAVGAIASDEGVLPVPEMLRTLRSFVAELRGGNGGAFGQIFDAEAVAGASHLASAVARASRARRRGRPRLDDAGAEVALYLAGSDQLPEALRRVGIRETTREFVVLTSPPGDPGALLRELHLVPDASVFPRPPTAGTLRRLGLDEGDLRSVPQERWEALAMEAGARVELSRPPSRRRKT